MTSPDRQYLFDILIFAEDAMSFVHGMSFENFVANELVRSAVLHKLTIIGEAAARIDRLTETEVPDLPWRRMKNPRNVLVHQYEGVNLPIIRRIVKGELPRVIAAIDPLFPERDSQ